MYISFVSKSDGRLVTVKVILGGECGRGCEERQSLRHTSVVDVRRTTSVVAYDHTATTTHGRRAVQVS